MAVDKCVYDVVELLTRRFEGTDHPDELAHLAAREILALREVAGEEASRVSSVLRRFHWHGWLVAAHYDYVVHDELRTHWLLVSQQDGRWVIGDGRNDAEALERAERQYQEMEAKRG